MKLKELTWLSKPTPLKANGSQITLEFGLYNLSIIDDGYGSDKGLYEIGFFKDGDMVELPGIVQGNSVRGFLTESEVDAILTKMYTITGTEGRQI
jgi:hypothetical protein|tara:strand:+ start:124 stop:408 length:285 start_codon:yes stop_codon:yes gene_type:complete